jgi:hypothetical protein
METETHQEVADNTPFSGEFYGSVENPCCGIAATLEQGSNEDLMMKLKLRKNRRKLIWLSDEMEA